MSSYLRQQGTRLTTTPQRERARPDQIKNEAGGFVFAADKWTRLRRFLILGSEGGAYYASERKLTTQNVLSLRECLAEDGIRFIEEVVEVSKEGLAPSNEPALFALACAISVKDGVDGEGNDNRHVRRYAAAVLPMVARMSTHLYHFVDYAESMRGWGKTMRWAVANWYESKAPDQVAYQAVKYRQRDGWSHRDLLRLSHPGAPFGDEEFSFRAATEVEAGPNASIYNWICHRDKGDGSDRPDIVTGQPIIEGYEAAQVSGSPKETAELVRKYQLPREALLTEHLNSTEVWEAMLWEGGKYGMPLNALIRNLATMTRNKVFESIENRNKATEMLTAQKAIQHARVHPLAILIAQRTYAAGRGYRGQNTWNPLPQLIDALDEGFYLAFDNVEPTGKRLLLAVDCSGSMTMHQVAGSPLTPREAAVAMTLVTLHAEPNVEVIAYDSRFYAANLSRRQRLDDALRGFPNTGNGTDCSLPALYAQTNNLEFDAIVQYTDSQTWYGNRHPYQAIESYRRSSGISNARSIVTQMAAYGATLNPPDDPFSLDVVGFDTSAPALISEFIAGRL